jgi:hypothetical protein
MMGELSLESVILSEAKERKALGRRPLRCAQRDNAQSFD